MKDVDISDVVVVSFTPEEFRARPLYCNDVFVIGLSPDKILGSYRVDEPIACGIQNCRQTHTHGYVVLMPEGFETNAGWDCGLDHFGPDFLELRKVYDRAERELSFRNALRERLPHLDGFRVRVHELKTQRHGGDWLLTNLRLFAKHYPPALIERLRSHAGRGDVSVPETAAHADAARERDPGARSRTDVKTTRDAHGVIVGLKIFKLDVEHWPLQEAERKLDAIATVDAEKIPFEEVRDWSAWLETLDVELTKFESLLHQGRKFFTRGNLDLLPYLADDQELKEQLMWMVLSKEAHQPVGGIPEKPSVLKRILIGLNS